MANEHEPSSSSAQQPNFQVRIPLEWEEDDEVPIVYANQVLISHAGPEFFIVFGTVVPPLNTSEIPDSFKIRPQVRVVVSRDAMGSVVQALTDNLRRFQDAQAKARARKDNG
ncbi:MAG: DUF3467 domain-containing protein [Anaerolineae bacterium]|jgi:hypothetical protein